MSFPPKMENPKPLVSFFNSILLGSTLAGDLEGDLAGDLAGVDDEAALASALGGSSVLDAAGAAVVAAVGDTGTAALLVGLLLFLASLLFSISSLGLTTKKRTTPVTCFKINAAFFKLKKKIKISASSNKRDLFYLPRHKSLSERIPYSQPKSCRRL